MLRGRGGRLGHGCAHLVGGLAELSRGRADAREEPVHEPHHVDGEGDHHEDREAPDQVANDARPMSAVLGGVLGGSGRLAIGRRHRVEP